MTAVALLDVNVLVALFDADHVHHEAAHSWLSANRRSGWATCPLTENGLIRILSNSGYSGALETPGAIRRRLDAFCSSGDHVFWPDGVSIRDKKVFDLGRTITFRQITDVYLLGLASHHDGRLATFDRRIPIDAVSRARPKHLEVIPA